MPAEHYLPENGTAMFKRELRWHIVLSPRIVSFQIPILLFLFFPDHVNAQPHIQQRASFQTADHIQLSGKRRKNWDIPKHHHRRFYQQAQAILLSHAGSQRRMRFRQGSFDTEGHGRLQPKNRGTQGKKVLQEQVRSDNLLIRLVKRVRQDVNNDIDFKDLVSSFAFHPPKKSIGPISISKLNTDDIRYKHATIYHVGQNDIEFHLNTDCASGAHFEQVLNSAHPTALKNMIGSLSAKLDRSYYFYRDLLASSGKDIKVYDKLMPRRILFYMGGPEIRNYYFARSSKRGTFLGYKMLLKHTEQVIHHEMFHTLANNVLYHQKKLYSSTPINEALADYFTAVAYNQPRILFPAQREVKNKYTEFENGDAFFNRNNHVYGQILSGYLWDLRKVVQKRNRAPWSEISDADKLSLVAYSDFIKERPNTPKVRLNTWIEAIIKADRQLFQGKYHQTILDVGERHLGHPGVVQ